MPESKNEPATVRSNSLMACGAYWALAALCTMNLLNYIDRFILAAVSTPVQEELDIPGKALTGILGMAFLVSYSVCSPLVGWLGDRMRRTHLLALGVGTWSLATFASGLAGKLHLPAFRGMSGGFWEMLAARSILGVGEATYTILAPALIADLFPRERRSLALAIFYIAIPIGAALGYGLGGIITGFYGWRMAFFVVGLPGLVVALLALALREPRRGETEAGGPAETPAPPPVSQLAGELVRNRSYVFNLLGMAMFAFALGGLQFWAPGFFESERHLDLMQVNIWLGVVVGFSGIVGPALGGWLSEAAGPWLGRRLPPRKGGGYFWLCGLTMLAAVPLLVIALNVTPPLVIFPILFLALTFALVNTGPSNAIIVNVTRPEVRASGVAVNLFLIHALGDIPSILLMGWMADLTGGLFWGLMLAVPAAALSGVFFCAGAPFLDADEEAVRHPRPASGAREVRLKAGAGGEECP